MSCRSTIASMAGWTTLLHSPLSLAFSATISSGRCVSTPIFHMSKNIEFFLCHVNVLPRQCQFSRIQLLSPEDVMHNFFFFLQLKQEAQLSQRDRTMLHVIEYFPKSCHSRSLELVLLESLETVSYSPSIWIWYYFWDKARYWSTIAIFSYPSIRRFR